MLHQFNKASRLVHFVVYGYVSGVGGHKFTPVPRGFWNSKGVSIWVLYSMGPIPHWLPLAISSASWKDC
jgi:hypothetical protein